MDPLRPDLMDMTQDQRRGFPRSLGILGALFLVAAGASWALAVYVRPLVPPWVDPLLLLVMVLLGIVAVSLAGVVVWLLTWTPRMLTRQGVMADPDGLLLFQDAKWWFSGRSLHVPWSALADVRDHRPGGLGDRSGLILHLRDLAPGARAPGWVMIVPAGGLPPEGQEQSDEARLYLTLPASGGEELTRLIDHWRRALRSGGGVAGPEAGVARARTDSPGTPFETVGSSETAGSSGTPFGAAGSEASGSSGTPFGAAGSEAAGSSGTVGSSEAPFETVGSGTAGSSGAPFGTAFSPGTSGPAERGTWLPVRGQRIVVWAVFPVVLVGTPLIMLVSFVRGSDAGWGSVAALVLAAVVAAGVLVSAALLPWYWAPQGVSGNEHGIAVRREPMWWAGSGGTFVPWADVRGVVTHNRAWDGAEETWGLPVVEIVVDHLDSGVRLPRWARTVPAGAQGWGTVADLPRLGITVSEPHLSRRIELLVRRARPDLVAGSAPTPGDGSGRYPLAGGVGTPARAPATSAVPAPDFRADQWIAVPRRGVEWAFSAVVMLAGMAALAAFDIADNLWFPALSAVPGAATAAHAAIVVVCGAVLVWIVAVTLPRRFARSGIRLTDDGLELVREDLWWSRGTRVALPWACVRDVRGSRGLASFPSTRPAWGTVDVAVESGRAPEGLPHWARTRARRGGEPGTVRVRLVVGDQGRRRLLAAARPGAPERA